MTEQAVNRTAVSMWPDSRRFARLHAQLIIDLPPRDYQMHDNLVESPDPHLNTGSAVSVVSQLLHNCSDTGIECES